MPWVAKEADSTILPMLVPAACLTVLGVAALVAIVKLGGERSPSAV